MVRIHVLSSHSKPSLTSPINHKLYCDTYGFEYSFDLTPYHNRTKYDQKLNSIRANLHRAEWLMWIDEDAFFLDFDKSILDFIPEDDITQIVICNSPVSPAGRYTLINTGVMFLRNTSVCKKFLDDVYLTDLQKVASWWDESVHGYFTNSEQDCFLYQILTNNWLNYEVKVHPFIDFNARYYHYNDCYNEYFICHFPGVTCKQEAIRRFQEKFNLNNFLTKHTELTDLSQAKDFDK